MAENLVNSAILALALYLVAGMVAAVYFHLRALTRIDPGVQGANLFFRALITPGLIALWPLMLRKTMQPGSDETAFTVSRLSSTRVLSTQSGLFKAVAVIAPIAVAVALILRPAEPSAAPPPVQWRNTVEPLQNIDDTFAGMFEGLPIIVRFRSNGAQTRQIELEVTEDLEEPAVGLFWSEAVDKPFAPADSRYVGPLWGPAVHRYPVPAASTSGGRFVIYSLATGEMLAVANMML